MPLDACRIRERLPVTSPHHSSMQSIPEATASAQVNEAASNGTRGLSSMLQQASHVTHQAGHPGQAAHHQSNSVKQKVGAGICNSMHGPCIHAYSTQEVQA
jgi:hypothetical protein